MSVRVVTSLLVLLASALAMGPIAGVAIAQTDPWQPPEPGPETDDWIRMSSGEWLRGKLEILRDDDVTFDSDDLDDLTLDWGDVVEIRSPRILTYGLVDGTEITGPGVMNDGVVRVQVGDVTQEFARDKLLSIIEGEPTEWNYWSGKASIGLTARSGNTDQADINSVILVRRNTTRTRLGLDYTGNFSRVQGSTTINNHSAAAVFDYFFSKRLFITPAAVNFYADKFQNIDSRFTAGAGVGYFFARGGKLDLSAGLGGGYQANRFVSVEAGQPDTEDTGAIIPGITLEMDIGKPLELDFNYTAQIGVPDTKNTTHHMFLLLTVETTSDLLEFTISFTWDRVENPKTTADGTVPRRDDFRTALGLGMSF